jgi:Ca2+-binding RTX toxin-like protein
MLQLLNLGGSVHGSGDQAVALDAGSDAAIVPGNGTLSSLTIEVVDFLGANVDVLDIAAVGGVSVPGGMNEESAIFVGGTEIGQIDSYEGYAIHIVLNEGVDKTHVEALLRALTYSNSSTAPVVAEERSVRVTLSETDGAAITSGTADVQVLVAPPNAVVLTGQSTEVTGTGGNDDFLVDAAAPLANVDLTGGIGNDTLHVVGGGLFNLDSTSISRFWGIETLSGSSAVDMFKISAEHFANLSTIDGGIGDDTFDLLDLRGNRFDFRGKTVLNFSEIQFAGGTNPTVVVDDKSIAQLFKAMTTGVHVRLVGDTFTAQERAALLANGIDSVSDDSNAHPPSVPTLSGNVAAEYAAAGTLVGLLSATDPDEDELTYTLIDDADGRFEIVDNRLQVADGFKLDFEQSASHTIRVRVSDGTESREADLVINVADINPENTAGSADNDVFKGGALADSLSGNGGNDRLFGGGGGDTLKGDAGDDALEGGLGNDVLDGGAGTQDKALFGGARANYSVVDNRDGSYTLSDGRAGGDGRDHVLGIELFQFSDGALTLAELLTAAPPPPPPPPSPPPPPPPDLVLVGTKRADRLMGGDGNDTLYGKAGKDVLTGGLGKDAFVFDTRPNKKTNLDRITDYSVADDTIWLENKVFTKLGKAAKAVKLNKKFFAFDKAKQADDHIVYVKKTGALLYDQDGSGTAHAAVQIATLTKNLKGFSAAEFFVV